MSQISRRRFIELTVGGAMGALLAACVGRPKTPQPTAAPTPVPGGPPLPNATRVRGNMVGNSNRPDRNIRYYRPFVPPTPEEWHLTVDGLVTTPLTLSFADIQQFPFVEQVSRMKCVECWSFKAQWGGFALASLLNQVQPTADGQFVRMECADGYWEVMPVEDLLRERVLFVYRMEGNILADEYGSPLRLIVPWKYGYKGAKCITKITFASELKKGYWSTVGPYTISGDIEPGWDHPQDMDDDRVPIQEGGVELLY